MTLVLHIPSGDLPEDALEALSARLPDDETHRADAMEWMPRRTEFVLGRSLLRHGFARHDATGRNWPLTLTEHGKPVLDVAATQSDLQFSIAHTDGIVCCALREGGPVGLDVERASRAPSLDGVKTKVLAASELASLSALSIERRAEKLLDLWTGKEAVTKAMGAGLTYDFRTLELDIAGDDLAVVAQPEWRLERYRPTAEHVAMLAIEGDAGPSDWSGVSLDELLDA